MLLWGLSVSVFLYLVPPYAASLGASETFVGVIGSVRALPYAFLPLVFGILSERVGKIRLYLVGVLVTMASAYLLYSSSSLMGVLYSQVVLGVGFALFFPITQSMVKDLSSLAGANLGRSFAYFASSWASAFILGPYLGGLISGVFGFKALTVSVLILLLVDLSLVASLASVLRAKAGKGLYDAEYSTREHPTVGRDVRLAMPVIIANLIEGFFFSIVVSMVPSLAYRRGLTYEEIGLSYSIMGLSRLALLLAFSRIHTLLSYKRWITLSALLASSSMLLIANSKDVGSFSIALALVGIAVGIFYPSTATLILSFKSSSTLMGLYEASLGVGFAISPILVGALVDNLGYTIPYLIVSVTSLLMLLGVKARVE